jgi:hypothetical protein
MGKSLELSSPGNVLAKECCLIKIKQPDIVLSCTHMAKKLQIMKQRVRYLSFG